MLDDKPATTLSPEQRARLAYLASSPRSEALSSEDQKALAILLGENAPDLFEEATADDAKRREQIIRHRCLATLVGYNELIKSCPTLGERVYNRLCFQQTLDTYRELGGVIEITQTGKEIFHLGGDARLHVVFREQDIALMRKYLADLDAAASEPTGATEAP
jgi:hypothetical protein